jgi:hypothetical protein
MKGRDSKPKGKENQKPELATIAFTSTTSSISSSALNPDTYMGDLSCAITEELLTKDLAALLSASGGFASILDSGTSSHLLKDHDVFWTYEVTQA